MTNQTLIRILAIENNRQGDLFGRLMSDLFVALGYDAPRLNVHKAGRELDLICSHRLERRRAIAECKATDDAIGGADINKFIGALDAEHDEQDTAVAGYFVSLSGFTETAIEQERQRRRTKIILMNGQRVVDELVKGRILIPREAATDLAGRLCGERSLTLDHTELLGHDLGWIWAVYYRQAGTRTHFALIRSDGETLPAVIAADVIATDRDCGGVLHTLKCLNPEPKSDTEHDLDQAIAAYRQYVANECGFIQFDGMPADGEIANRPLKLESLFVPVHLDIMRRVTTGHNRRKVARRAVGAVLKKHRRLALLAPPGGGKSTLLKRLALAYSDPTRRDEIGDGLPDYPWLPVFVRCRDLRGTARGTFSDVLDDLAHREPIRAYAEAFRTYVDRELLAGRVLLLVDGVDEISDSGDRAIFVCMLRATLLAYPNIAAVISSREAGFRHVAAHLAAVCNRVRLSPLDAGDITQFTLAWSRHMSGDTEAVRVAAEQLAATINANDRIQRLAGNPLLLTTLLLVKRWVGTIPTRRAVLYGKAVEVLLMTWNVEGHEPIPQEIALPQLCYVAWTMTEAGMKEISRPRLAKLLREARNALPIELGYVHDTVDQFIRRVEDRSSLLMMTGHSVEDGQLVEFFEFRHLTFQEFLTAKAAVEGWHAGRRDSDTLANVLDHHFTDEAWREVIPLAAVLGGKAADALILSLSERARHRLRDQQLPSLEADPFYLALGSCLADEAPARPTTVRAALRELIRFGSLDVSPFTRPLALGRYGMTLHDQARDSFLAADDLRRSGRAFGRTLFWQAIGDGGSERLLQALTSFRELVANEDRVQRCSGALGIAALCPRLLDEGRKDERVASGAILRDAGNDLVPMVFSEDVCQQWAAIWAIFEMAGFRVWAPPAVPDALGRLFALWQQSQNADVARLAGWALARQQICLRDSGQRCATVTKADLDRLMTAYPALSRKREQPAVLAAAWYSRGISDEDLTILVRELLAATDDRVAEMTARELLRQLGQRA